MRPIALLAIVIRVLSLAQWHCVSTEAGEMPPQVSRPDEPTTDLPNTSAIMRPIVPKADEGTLYSISYSPDGKSIATSNILGVVKVFEASTGRPIALIRPEGDLVLAGFPVSFAPDGKALATPISSGQWALFDLATGRMIRAMDPHPGVLDRTVRTAVAFSPDGKRLAGCYDSGEVVFWDVASGRRGRVLPPYIKPAWREGPIIPGGTETNWPARPQEVTDLTFSPDGATLYTSAFFFRSWNLNASVESRRFDLSADLPCGCVAVTPDGATLAVAIGYTNATLPFPAVESRLIALVDAASGRKKAEMVVQTNGIQGLAFLAEGRVLASLDHERVIRLWDVATANPIVARRFDEHFRLNSLAVSPDGRRIAAAGYSSNEIFGVIGIAETDGAKLTPWRPAP